MAAIRSPLELPGDSAELVTALRRIAVLEAERASLEAYLESVGLMIVRMDQDRLTVAIQPGGGARLREAFKL